MRQSTLDSFFFNQKSLLSLIEVDLELHGVFWFHTFAQPRDKYTHIMVPVVHNYPILLALLGIPSEAYASVSGKRTFAFKPETVWDEHGFYVYPAIVRKAVSRILTFSMGGTGYVQFKPKTRASIPDYTANQVFLPGTVFKTYILARGNYTPPPIIRLGSKRYGVFRVNIVKRRRAYIKDGASREVTHPFNARDVDPMVFHGVLNHYAGIIAISGVARKVVTAGSTILALPKFVEAGVSSDD